MRMTRRRARQRRLHAAQERDAACGSAQVAEGARRFTRRMARARRSRQAREALLRQGVLIASFSCVCLLRVTVAAAASHEVLHGVLGEVQTLREARETIRNYHAAQQSLRAAQDGVRSARENLAAAQAGQADAAHALAAAREHLAASRQALADARQVFVTARAAAEEKAQAAQEAQQAVSDYAPRVEALRADVSAAAAESASVESAYEAAVEEAEIKTRQDRAAAVAAACEAVGYEQRRLVEAERLAAEALAAVPDRRDEVESDYRGWLDALASSLDASEAALDEAEGELDDLVSAAEDAAIEAAAAQQEAAQAEADVQEAAQDAAQSEKDAAEAEDYDREAATWAAEAARDLRSAEDWQREAADDLAHFGEGEGIETGFEYYSWRGRRAGHQLSLPISYYASRRQAGHMVDFGLSAAHVSSVSGYTGGAVHGFQDTTLAVTWHNDHPRDSVRYHFTLNVPTGESRVYQAAVLPDGLAAMTSFGVGWEYTPAVEWVHHATERDEVHASLAYTWRAAYDYAKESPGASVHLGGILAQEVSYRHIGEAWQSLLGLRHTRTGWARQETFDYDGWLAGGSEAAPITGEVRYRDGETWGLKWLYNRQVAPRDEYYHYLAFDFTDAEQGYEAGRVYEQFACVGVRHASLPQLHWQAALSYQHVNGNSASVERRLPLGGAGGTLVVPGEERGAWSRYGLMVGMEWQPRPEEQLTLALEQYVRRDTASAGYHGWEVAFWYSRAL